MPSGSTGQVAFHGEGPCWWIGALRVAPERQLALVDGDGAVELLPEVWDDPDRRFIDGGCDPDGRFCCGSTVYDQRPGVASRTGPRRTGRSSPCSTS